ncbi:MAG: exodeoxyribonuclease V subunit gamma [Leptospira sp.]|nr:exodeoxyribonuclease V subunit gamma [Leptospira sp.]
MAIHYTKSTRIQELTGLLWDRIRSEKSGNPLHAPKVIVPNKNMRKWLNLHLANRFGLVSHIDFSFLEKTLEEYFTKRSGQHWKSNSSTYPTQDEIQKQILEYLITHSREPEFSSLNKFTQRPSKLFGLSQKLALLFRDYEVNRREWLQIWWEDKKSNSGNKSKPTSNTKVNSASTSGKSSKNSNTGFLFPDSHSLQDPSSFFANNGYYAIEKKIYSDLFLPDTKSPEPKTLTQWLYQETGLMEFNPISSLSKGKNTSLISPTKAGSQSDSKIPSKSPIHLFCLSQLGYGYLEILDALANQDELDIYFYQFHSEGMASENSVFKDWQKPQMIIENYCKTKSNAVWPKSKFYQTESTGGRTDSKSTTGLSFLKSLIDSQPISGNQVLWKERIPYGSPDASVRFWNAPSTYREVEAVHQDILYKISKDSSLCYEDFAVLVTDMSSYKSAIEWAFEGGCLIEVAEEPDSSENDIRRIGIPYSLSDINAGDSSYLFSALQELWKICKRDRLDLQSFKKLLSNPHIFFHIGEDTKQELIETLDVLQVKYEESEREDDSFLISRGIVRTRLGAFFTKNKANELFGLPVLENTSEELAITLSTIWEELLSIRELLVQKFSKESWTKENLTSISLELEKFYRLREDDNEFYLFQKWKENLMDWKEFQTMHNSITPGDKKTKANNTFLNSRRDAFELLSYITANSFQSIPYQVGDYLTYGVNVSLLQPMRPIPFRHIYILGLGEGKFPGRTDRSELNLRAQSHIPGRDTKRREVQEALFWETLHSAQDSLTLSYVGKDLKADKTFEPCSTLANLMNALKISRSLEIPMHGYSNHYTNYTIGIDNSSSSGTHLSLVDMGLVSYDYSRVWKESDSSKKEKLLTRFTNPRDLEMTQKDTISRHTSIQNKYFLRELIRHFRDPLSDYMNRKLQIYRDYEDENLEETDYEIFHLDNLTRSILIREFYPILLQDIADSQKEFTDAVSWQESWTEERIHICLEEIYAPHRKSANFPQRIFSEVQMAEFVSGVQNIISIWGTHLWGYDLKSVPYLVLGNTGLRKPGTQQILDGFGNPAKLLVNIENRNIQILHEWETCFQIADKHWIWIYPKSLDNKILYDGFNGYHKSYWDNHSQVFFSLLVAKAMGIRLTILNHKSLPDDETAFLFGDSIVSNLNGSFQKEIHNISYNREEALSYLQLIIQSVENEEMPYFSSMNFLRFVTEKKIQSNRNSAEIWEADNSEFQEYLLEDKETALSELPDPVSLYSDVESILEKMSLDFAKTFYRPLLQLYPES